VVFTALYHIQRGECCGNKCLNCPYEPKYEKGNVVLAKEFIKFTPNNFENGRKNTWIKQGGGATGYKYTEEQKQKMSKPRINRWEREKLVSHVIVEEIRTKFQSGSKRSDLSREYNVSWGTIKNITDHINSYR
jgi:hypothetical protein